MRRERAPKRPVRANKSTPKKPIKKIEPKPPRAGRFNIAKEVISDAITFLNKEPGLRILVKVTKNMGDALHALPIIKHYRLMYPDARIAFLTSELYGDPFKLNEDISTGGLFLLPNGLTPQERLALWPIIKENHQIDIAIIPAINPFQAIYKQNAWSYPNITDQYLANAGIKDLKPLGGRRYTIKLSEDEKNWAKAFFNNRGINPNDCFILEYHSYSHPVHVKGEFLSRLLKNMPDPVKGIAVAGKNEGLPGGYIDARGISWTQTVALANLVPKMIGVGSGITMLCAGAENQPQIFELGVPPSVTMKNCGYADSVLIKDLEINNIVKRFMNR